MTLLQLVQTECPNYEADGGCTGTGIAADLGPVPIGRKPRCVLAVGGPCRHFEECVLAGIPGTSNERKASEWQEAADQYEENRREYERRSGEDGVGRGGDRESPGLYAETGSVPYPGGRTPGDQVGTRVVRVSGRGRTQVALGKEIQSRINRSDSEESVTTP